MPLLCRGGSDWERIKILEVNQNGTSQEMNDTLGNVKFSATAWAPDSKVIHLLPARAWLSTGFLSYIGPTTMKSAPQTVAAGLRCIQSTPDQQGLLKTQASAVRRHLLEHSHGVSQRDGQYQDL